MAGNPASPEPLAIGRAGDPLEHEADRIAERVVGGVEGRSAGSHAAPIPARPAAGDLHVPLNTLLPGPGRPLDPETRAAVEPRLGADLKTVRVHVGPAADRSTEALHAQAFTVGRDIVFADGAYAPGTAAGRRLLAHELAHVVQQRRTGPRLQRQPRPGAENPGPGTAKRPEPGDAIVEIRRERDVWTVMMSGVDSVEVANVLLWKKYVPPRGVKVLPRVTVVEPAAAALVEIQGLTSAAVTDMEPSVAARFARMGLTEQSDAGGAALTQAFNDARAKFWKESELDAGALRNIDKGLKRVAADNLELMIAFYEYYARHHLGNDPDDGLAGSTDSGDSEIDAGILALTTKFKTDDPVTLLGGTLLHEYSHTPQGGKTHGVAAAPLEAKAYAIEVFFSDRLNDEARADVIYKRYRNDPVDIRTGSDKIFLRTYWYMKKLYEVIDTGGLDEARQAREMSVEFISKNEADYSSRLKSFLSRHAR